MNRALNLFFAAGLLAVILSCQTGSYRPGEAAPREATRIEFDALAAKMRSAFEHAVGCENFEVGLRGFTFSGQYVRDAGYIVKPRTKRFKSGVFDETSLTPGELTSWEQRLVMFEDIEGIEVKGNLFGFGSEVDGCRVPGRSPGSLVMITTKKGRVCIGFEEMAAAREFADAACGLAGLGVSPRSP
jgi:hypothetical protein